MKRRILSCFLTLFCLCGCQPDNSMVDGLDEFDGVRPSDFPNTQWVSENPPVSLYFDEEELYCEASKDGQTVRSRVVMAPGTYFGLELGIKYGFYRDLFSLDIYDNDCILQGDAKFSETEMILTVDSTLEYHSDYLYHFKYPTITFVREDLEVPIKSE